MSIPFLVDSKRATTDIAVELTRSQAPPALPFELKDHISPNRWETRVSTLTRLVSQYCRPTFERAYLVVILVLTFLATVIVYYLTVQTLENTAAADTDKPIWLVRFSCFAIMVATWIVLSAPVAVWKYVGRVRVKRLVDQWTKTDAHSAPSYGAAPVWRASSLGLFRNAIVLTVTIPSTKKSHFDRDSRLPPYVSAGDDGLPSYGDSRMIQWSQDFKGGIKYGELPMYTDNQLV